MIKDRGGEVAGPELTGRFVNARFTAVASQYCSPVQAITAGPPALVRRPTGDRHGTASKSNFQLLTQLP